MKWDRCVWEFSLLTESVPTVLQRRRKRRKREKEEKKELVRYGLELDHDMSPTNKEIWDLTIPRRYITVNACTASHPILTQPLVYPVLVQTGSDWLYPALRMVTST